MFHGMSSPHRITDMFKAHPYIQSFCKRITFVDKQSRRNSHVRRFGYGNTQQITGNATSTVLLVYSKTVYVKFTGRRLVTDSTVIASETFSRRMYKSLSQFMKPRTVVSHTYTGNTSVIIQCHMSICITILRIIGFHKPRHHPFKVFKTMLRSGIIPATIIIHCLHYKPRYCICMLSARRLYNHVFL